MPKDSEIRSKDIKSNYEDLDDFSRFDNIVGFDEAEEYDDFGDGEDKAPKLEYEDYDDYSEQDDLWWMSEDEPEGFFSTKGMIVFSSIFALFAATILICIVAFTKGDTEGKFGNQQPLASATVTPNPSQNGNVTGPTQPPKKVVTYNNSTASLNVTIVPGYTVPENWVGESIYGHGGGGGGTVVQPTKAPAWRPIVTTAPIVATPTPNVYVPTTAPTQVVTQAPTTAPTDAPTEAPTTAPTEAPTEAPTTAPTEAPTTAPTQAPTEAPTQAPTAAPTEAPTTAPTQAPADPPASEGTEAQ